MGRFHDLPKVPDLVRGRIWSQTQAEFLQGPYSPASPVLGKVSIQGAQSGAFLPNWFFPQMGHSPDSLSIGSPSWMRHSDQRQDSEKAGRGAPAYACL